MAVDAASASSAVLRRPSGRAELGTCAGPTRLGAAADALACMSRMCMLLVVQRGSDRIRPKILYWAWCNRHTSCKLIAVFSNFRETLAKLPMYPCPRIVILTAKVFQCFVGFVKAIILNNDSMCPKCAGIGNPAYVRVNHTRCF